MLKKKNTINVNSKNTFFNRGSSLILIVIIVAGMPQIGCAPVSQPQLSKSEGAIHIREYEVFGMDCPGCSSGLVKLVNKIPGVLSSDALWQKQLLKVQIDPAIKVDDESIFDAIKRANFTPGKRLDIKEDL